MRIVSLLASSTELVCALGFQKDLVGRSHECDYPESVKKLPIVSKPKFNPEGTAREIDERVREIVEKSLSVYKIDTEKLKSLKPDIIVTQDQCEVCAVSVKEVEDAVCELLESKPQIVTLHPDRLQDVWDGFVRTSEVLGKIDRGRELVLQCQSRMEEVSRKARQLPGSPSVLCVEWFDPLMMAANWIPEFIEMLGGRNLFGQAGDRAPRTSWEAAVQSDPDIIVMMPCGWDIARSRQESKALTSRPGWNDLRAVREGRVYVTESNQYFNRPGPRLVESLEILAEIMYPAAFSFGHQGKGWEKF